MEEHFVPMVKRLSTGELHVVCVCGWGCGCGCVCMGGCVGMEVEVSVREVAR